MDTSLTQQKLTRTSIAIWIWISFALLFIATAIFMAPSDKQIAMNIVPSIVLNIAFFSYTALIAIRVRRGKSITIALLLLVIYGVLGLMFESFVIFGNISFKASVPLFVSFFLLVVVYINALVMTARVYLMTKTDRIV